MGTVLASHQLIRKCDLNDFDFLTTEDIKSHTRIIGQPRGTRAIEFGVSIDSPGYNIYVLGESGTGRTTAITRFIESCAASSPVPPDWVYANNFLEPHKPIAIRLSPGMGCLLRDTMDSFVERLQTDVEKAFDNQAFRDAVLEIQHNMSEKREEIFGELQATAKNAEAALINSPEGLRIVPAKGGQPIQPNELANMTEEQQAQWRETAHQLDHLLSEAIHNARQLESEMHDQMRQLIRRVAKSVVDVAVDEVKGPFTEQPKVLAYLDRVREDVLDHIDLFRVADDEDRERSKVARSRGLRRYKINVVVDQKRSEGAPVIVEYNPTLSRLLGRVEHESRMGGAIATDFTLIRGGALHAANGGFLVVRARDLFQEPGAWDGLKRALIGEAVRPDDPAARGGAPTSSLDPEEIPLDLKVIMIGPAELYYLLYEQDEDFRTIFKVMADFDREMERNKTNEMEYVTFIATRCHEESLHHFDRSAAGRVIEFSSRLAGSQNRLSTRFGEIADLVREASYWAEIAGREVVTESDVQRAINEQEYFHNRIEVRLLERIEEGKQLIATEGEVVGQINGLSVVQIGEHAFGQASRVTSRTYLGKEGVVQIDREVKLAGPIHNKGVLTLVGYLGGKYAEDHPLSLSAQITFEQNYGGIEGDSAASTELYALLSSLSGFPIRQSLAVTGSVNQRGEIQAIGGVNEKVEGWFDICKAQGLRGDNGALVPASNVQDLMLREDVVKAVEEGKFKVWSVSTVDEGIEILTGHSASEVHAVVKQRLEELAEKYKDFNG